MLGNIMKSLNHSQPSSCSWPRHPLLTSAATSTWAAPCSPSCCPWHSRTSLYSPAKVALADALQAMLRPMLATKPVKFDLAAGKLRFLSGRIQSSFLPRAHSSQQLTRVAARPVTSPAWHCPLRDPVLITAPTASQRHLWAPRGGHQLTERFKQSLRHFACHRNVGCNPEECFKELPKALFARLQQQYYNFCRNSVPSALIERNALGLRDEPCYLEGGKITALCQPSGN